MYTREENEYSKNFNFSGSVTTKSVITTYPNAPIFQESTSQTSQPNDTEKNVPTGTTDNAKVDEVLTSVNEEDVGLCKNVYQKSKGSKPQLVRKKIVKYGVVGICLAFVAFVSGIILLVAIPRFLYLQEIEANTTPIAPNSDASLQITGKINSLPTSTTTTAPKESKTTAAFISERKWGTDIGEVKVYCLHDLLNITEKTSQVKIYKTNHISSEPWSWFNIPKIRVQNLSLEICESEIDHAQDIRHILEWLSPSLETLKIDGKFAIHNCKNATIPSFYPKQSIQLQNVLKLHIENLNMCFVHNYLEHIKFPNLVELQILMTDEDQYYREILVNLIAKHTPSLVVFNVCEQENGCGLK